MGIHSKHEAKAIISELDLKPIDTYVDCVKRDYNKVMVEEKKLKRNKRIEIKPVDDAMIIKPVVIEQEHEVVIEKENE
jgi:hypothetical protein